MERKDAPNYTTTQAKKNTYEFKQRNVAQNRDNRKMTQLYKTIQNIKEKL